MKAKKIIFSNRLIGSGNYLGAPEARTDGQT